MDWAKNDLNDPSVSYRFSYEKLERPLSYGYFTDTDLSHTIDFSKIPKLNFIQNASNKGFAAGNNLIVQYLLEQNAYIWLLNPDMVVRKNTLSELVNFAGLHPFKSIIGSVVKFYSDLNKVHLYGGAKINFDSATVNLIKREQDILHIDFVCGGSMFVHASHFKEIGLLPEDYFLYWEEAEWCYRAKKKGYQMQICTTAVCYDKISTTIGKTFLADYYYTRNGLLFISKFRTKKVPMAVFYAVLRLSKRLVKGQWSRSKGVYKGILEFLKRKKYEDK
jgi:GT2 family glycosyltransferase